MLCSPCLDLQPWETPPSLSSFGSYAFSYIMALHCFSSPMGQNTSIFAHLLLLSPSTGAGSRAGGSGERDRQTATAYPQQDGHVCHRLSGQVLLPIGPCHQSCPGLPLCSAPPGACHPTAGPRGALGSRRWHFKGHAGQAQRDGCALWLVPGLRAVQRGGVLLALPAERACPLCTLEPLMAAPLPKERAYTLFSKCTWRGVMLRLLFVQPTLITSGAAGSQACS